MFYMGHFRKGQDQMSTINGIMDRPPISAHALVMGRPRRSDFPLYEVLELEPGQFICHAQGRVVDEGPEWACQITANRMNMHRNPPPLNTNFPPRV